MSAFNFGGKPCGPGPEENGCLCPACKYFRKEHEEVPEGCSPHACGNCDPDRTEPDDGQDYGPMRECKHFRQTSGEIAKAALEGAKVTITPDCYPCRGAVKEIRVSMTKQTWNGVVTLNRRISAEVGPEKIDVAIIKTVGEMAEAIEIPGTWKG